MKTKIQSLILGLALLVGVYQAAAQLPVISSFGQNGVLVCTNLAPGSVATLLEAATVNGPWTTNADGLSVTLNGTLQVNGLTSPTGAKFYRVRGAASAPPPTPVGMALIPAGDFTMGDTLDGNIYGDAPPTSVTVSAFYMGTNLVGWSQWQTVYDYATNHGYQFFTNTTYSGDYQAGGKAENHPVQTVNWYDCVKWSNARSVQAGLVPVYYTDAGLTQVYTNGEPATVYQNMAVNGYRLPTEAEWERAARGGLSGQRFPWGDTISESQANYYSYWADGVPYFFYDVNSDSGYNTNYNTGGYPYTSPVGAFAPNGYGLYDMAGNVFEWCWDWYGTPYGQPSTINPTGAGSGSGVHVLRGGYWSNNAVSARCANRGVGNPYVANYGIGFRCVRGL